jgi:hypothetical protein
LLSTGSGRMKIMQSTAIFMQEVIKFINIIFQHPYYRKQ